MVVSPLSAPHAQRVAGSTTAMPMPLRNVAPTSHRAVRCGSKRLRIVARVTTAPAVAKTTPSNNDKYACCVDVELLPLVRCVLYGLFTAYLYRFAATTPARTPPIASPCPMMLSHTTQQYLWTLARHLDAPRHNRL